MALKSNTFIHAMNNAQVMFQFVSDTKETAETKIEWLIKQLIDYKVIDSREADVEVEIGADIVEDMVLSRVWIWVPIDKMTALHTFAAMIPIKEK